GIYTTELNCHPITRTNGFSLTGENWVTIPKGATYSGGDGSTETVASEDGNLTRILSDSSNVRFDLAAIEASVGEVRVQDGTTQVYNHNHVFTGSCIISNGIYKVVLSANTITVYYWSGSAYTKIDDFTAGTFSNWYLTEVNPDIVKVQTSNGIKIEVERGRVPFIATGSVTLTCTSLAPANQTTTTDNYLTLGTNMYVATDTEMSIASNVISAGNRWIFYAASGVADAAQNCLTISNLRRTVVERW
ncbi:MAG TPA: hypothetical protein PLK94_07885, partial [Alphaproteobacteria bacterium]|nr:hypothetical protein [Alphaproteobacteria bacterium]